MMQPDFITAATQAASTLLKFNIAATPIYPHRILQSSPLATLISFADLADLANVSQNTLLSAIHSENDLAMSSVHHLPDGSVHYLFAYNHQKPNSQVRFALAAELGHIYLGHVGFRDNATRFAESMTFTHHLLFPRALIRLLEERNFAFTRTSFSHIFGECHDFLSELLNDAEPVSIFSGLNAAVKDQFRPFVDALSSAGILDLPVDPSEPRLDFSTYMSGYED